MLKLNSYPPTEFLPEFFFLEIDSENSTSRVLYKKNQAVFLAFDFCVSTGIFSVALSWKKSLSDINLIFSAHSFKKSFNVSGLAFLAKSELKKSYPEIFFGPRTRNFKAGVP